METPAAAEAADSMEKLERPSLAVTRPAGKMRDTRDAVRPSASVRSRLRFRCFGKRAGGRRPLPVKRGMRRTGKEKVGRGGDGERSPVSQFGLGAIDRPVRRIDQPRSLPGPRTQDFHYLT